MTIRNATSYQRPIIHWRVWCPTTGESEADSHAFMTSHEKPRKAAEDYVEQYWDGRLACANDLVLEMRRGFPKGPAYQVLMRVEADPVVMEARVRTLER